MSGGWQDGQLAADSAPPAAQSSGWQETPIAANSMDLSSPANPPGYAQSPEQSAHFEASGHITKPYVRIAPDTGQWFLRSPSASTSPPPAAPIVGAPTAGGPTDSQTTLQASPQPSTQPQAIGTWQDGAVVGDSPQLSHARQDASGRLANDPAWIRAIDNGAAFGAGGIIDAGGAALETGAHNTVSHAFGLPDSGYGMGDAYTAVRDANRTGDQQFAQQHPWLNGGLGLLGMYANPASRFAGKYVMGARGLLPAVGRTAIANGVLGAMYGAGSAAPDEHINGAIQGLGFGVLTAPLGPVAGKVLSPIARPIGDYIASNIAPTAAKLPGLLGEAFQSMTNNSQPAQMTAARDALSRIGVDFDTLPQSDQDAIGAQIASGRNGGQAAMQQAGQGLPVPVPLTQGQMTGLPGQQLEENLALRGARGVDPSIYARDFQMQQQAALRGNVQAIGTQLGGGQPIAPGQAGATVSDALNVRYDAAKTGVDKAYDAARAAGPTTLPAYDAQSLAGQVRQSVGTYDPLNIPRVAREVDRLNVLGLGQTDPDIGDLFAARTRLTNLRASNDPVEAGAAGAAVKAFDQGINDNLTQSLFQGDPAAVQSWKTAIGARRDFGNLFQGNDLIEKLTTRQPIGGQMQLAVDPHDASNYIFGRSDLGFVGRQNLLRDVSRLKTVLGPDSPAWQSLKAEAFARVANAADGTIENGTTQFSGSRFQKGWQDMNAADSMLTATLFTPEERATIDRFAGVAARVTNPVRGGDNPSNTSVGAQALAGAVGAIKRLPFMALKAVPFVDHVADALQNAQRVGAVKAATIGAAPQMFTPPVSAQFGAASVAPITTMTETGLHAAN